MSSAGAVAVRPQGEYPRQVRALLHFLVLMSVALLPLTSFAARAGAPIDLTSSAAVEIEQGAVPASGQKTAPAQPHRHCAHWAAEAGACLALSNNVSAKLLTDPFGSPALGSKMAGPEAATPPPKA